MPMYEYRCDACGERFSLLQPMSAPRDGNPCPVCGDTRTRRVMSSFATSAADGSGGCGPGSGSFR